MELRIVTDISPCESRSLRNSSALVKCRPTTSAETTHFAFESKYDCIRPPVLRAKLPWVKVRDEYPDVRIAWPMNVLHQIMGENYLMIDGGKLCPHDPVSMDIEQQHFSVVSDSKRAQHMDGVGNCRATLSFSRKLPKKNLTHTLGGVYNPDVPLYIFALDKGHAKTYAHVFTFERLIKKLLRMEIKRDGKWVPVTNDEEKLQYVKVENGVEMLSAPELFGRYVNYDEEEKDQILCHLVDLPNFNPLSPGKKGVSVHFRQYVKMNSIVQPSAGSVVTTTLTCPHPTVAIVSVSANQEAVESSCTSNYTTTPSNPANGEDPVDTVEIMANRAQIIPKTPSDYVCCDYETVHAPIHAGYRIYAFCKDLCVVHPDSSNVITDGIMTNVYKKNTGYSGTYTEHTYLVTIREYRYVNSDGAIVIKLI